MLAILATLAASIATVLAQADDSAIVSKLLTANTQVTKVADITPDSQYVFDFMKGSRGSAQGGFAVAANSATFPALLTGNGAMTVGVLGPCGANPPHTHPRATELQILVEGGPIFTEFIMENGALPVKNNVSVGMATIFPKGSIHLQQNMGCEPAVFVASFDDVDPGTSLIAQNFFALDQGVVDATLGEVGVNILDHLKLPAAFILGSQECLDRCHLDRSTFNFSSSSFKDYAIFSNSTWTSSSSSAGSSSLAAIKVSGGSATTADATVGVPFDKNPLKGAVIGLGAAAGALLLAVIGLAGMMFSRRRSVRTAPPAASHFPSDDRDEPRGYPYATPYDDTEGLTGSRQSIIEHKQ